MAKEEKTKKNASEENTSVATVASDNSTLPAFLKKNTGAGMEDIALKDLEIPRVKLLQAISPEVVEGGFKPGQFYHTVMEDVIGDEITIVPLLVCKEYILWEPGRTSKILARARDGKHWEPKEGEFKVKLGKNGPDVVWKLAETVLESGLADWGSSNPKDPNSEPAATEMFNVLIAFPNNPELGLAVISLQRSTIKIARKFLSKMKLSQAAIFHQLYTVTSVDDKNGAGQLFKNFKFQANGFVQSEDQAKRFEELHVQFSKTGFDVKDLETTADEGNLAEGATDADLEAAAKKKF